MEADSLYMGLYWKIPTSKEECKKSAIEKRQVFCQPIKNLRIIQARIRREKDNSNSKNCCSAGNKENFVPKV